MLEQLLASLAGAPPQNRLNMLPPGMDERAAMSNPQAIAAMYGQGPAMGAPSPAPMPQQPAQAPQQPSGGGFLQSLFNPRASGENATIGWLQTQGMDQGTATLLARNKTALQSYLLNRTKGRDPMVINGRVVDPNTYEVLADFSDKSGEASGFTLSEGQTRYGPDGRVIAQSGSKTQDNYRVLSPQEVDAMGLPPGNYQISPKGQVDPITTVRDQDADFGRYQDVRKEIQSLPSYKNFSQAAPIYDTMVDALGRDTKASDLNLVYGLGKIFDPGSVVREGEMVLVQDTASLPDWLIGSIQSVNGGARLQANTRQAIIQEARSRIDAYKGMLDNDLVSYRQLAEKFKLDANFLIPRVPNLRDIPVFGEQVAPQSTQQMAPQGPMPKADEATPDFLRTMPMPKAYKDGGGTEQGWRFISPEKRRLWLDE